MRNWAYTMGEREREVGLVQQRGDRGAETAISLHDTVGSVVVGGSPAALNPVKSEPSKPSLSQGASKNWLLLH